MQIPARLLVIALLAVALYLPAAIGQKPAIGQQPGTVNVRPRVATPLVTVDRNRVPLGELVTFTLTPAGVAMSSRSKVTIYFGVCLIGYIKAPCKVGGIDLGEHQVMRQTEIDHLYTRPGNYTYSILVEPSVPPPPTPTPVLPGVKLTATPRSVEIDRPVDFAAQLSRPYPNIRYNFVFGDKNQTDWQGKPGTTHAYKVAGRYLAYVDIGVVSRGGVEPLGGSVRQPIEVVSPPPQPVSVTLTASPIPVAEKQLATFIARVDSNLPNISYRFDFGDRSGSTVWQASPQTTHKYSTAGNYPATVEIRVLRSSQSGRQTATSNRVLMEVTAIKPEPKASVDLTVIPQSALAGLPVFFRATTASANSNTRYRFHFGDGSSGDWRAQPTDTHIYSPGTYLAFVEIGSAGNQPIAAIATSGKKRVRMAPFILPPPATPTPPKDRPTPQPSTSPRPSPPIPSPTRTSPTPGPSQSPIGTASPTGSPSPSVPVTPSPTPEPSSSRGEEIGPTSSPSPTTSPAGTPTPNPTPDGGSNNWWKYLLAALILFAGYQGWKYFYAPRPTLVPNLDPGNSDLGSESGPLGINFQMELNRNVTDGQVAVNTDGGSLIKSERKSDD
jgi:hypothetical protein